MKLCKDTYEYLTNFADDKTIICMFSVNKKFSNDIYFERVLIRKYPFLLNFKKVENFKSLFIRMTYYMDKIYKEYGIPYIPNIEYNPSDFMYGSKLTIYNVALRHAVCSGKLDIVKIVIDKGARNFNLALSDAAFKGHTDILNFLIQKGATGFDYAMYKACKAGNLSIIKILIKDAGNLNYALAYAAEEGHIDVIRYLITKGADDYEFALFEASGNNKIDVVEYLMRYPISSDSLEQCVKNGKRHKKIVKFFKKYGDF